MVCLRTQWETNCSLWAIIPIEISKAVWCHLNWLLHVHAVVLYFKLVTQSSIIYYGMPKYMVRNELIIKCNYTYRNFKGNFMPSKLTPTCSCSCFVQFKLVTQSPIIYYGMPKSIVGNKLFNACRETPHVV